MKKYIGKRTAVSFLKSLLKKGNMAAYEIVYATIYYFILYFITRSAIKWNKPNIAEMWKYWLHLFIGTNKTHYALITVKHFFLMNSFCSEVLDAYLTNKTVIFEGNEGNNISIDGFNEIVHLFKSFHQFFNNFINRLTGMPNT